MIRKINISKKPLMDGEVVNTVQNEYDDENRLISSNDKSYSYDKDGNQIQAGETSFDYMTSFVNGKNVKRLKSVEESGEHVGSYSYTLEGQRTGKYLDSGESEISYHYNGRNVQYEEWTTGRTVRYTHPVEGGSSCSSCGGCGGGSNGGVFTDHPISIELNGTKYYYLYNGQGSVTELIDADEEVVNQYRYTPFGSPRLKVESVYNPYQYTGRRLDEETGQYYYRARMYSAEQSRFTTQDPAGMQEGPNLYAYVENNPLNQRDPSGLGPGEDKIDGGGGSSSDEYDYSICPGSPSFDSCWECLNDDTDLIPDEDCEYVCYETYPPGYSNDEGDEFPSFSIDDDEFASCLADEMIDVGSDIAGCIVSAVAAGAIAAAAVAGGFTVGNPEPISSSVSGAVSLAAMGYVAIGATACISAWQAMSEMLEMTYCGIKALEWE